MPHQSDINPPKWADQLLEWYCSPDILPEIQGDLHEVFLLRVKKYGPKKARRLFIKEVFLFFRPSSFKRPSFTQNHSTMSNLLFNYCKVAFRNFRRNALYTFINGFGLALGLSCSLLILLWVYFENKVDRFHPEGDQIYRVYFNGVSEEGEITFTHGYAPYALYTFLEEYEGVEKAAIYDGSAKTMLANGERVFREQGAWASLSFFEIFDYPMVAGNIENARNNLQTIFLSEQLAEKLFGENWSMESVGSTLRINDEEEKMVAGVFKNVGSNSSLQFEFIANMALTAANHPEWAQHWGAKNSTVFAKLPKEISPKTVEDYVNPIYVETNGYGVGGDAMMLFPFEKNYLWTKFEQGIASGGKVQYTRIFFGAALFLILIACINFINLSTAQSSRRAKEVGIRKTVGAQRGNLLFQFLCETGLLVFIGLFIALTIGTLLLPFLNQLTGQIISIPWQEPPFWLILIGLGIALTLIAGLYPALLLSRYHPAKVLKKGLGQKEGNLSLRKSLVVFQFTLSAILIISTITVHNQLNLIQHENLGLDRSNVMAIRMNSTISEQYTFFKEKLLQNSSISEVLRASHAPIDIGWISVGFDWEGKTEDHSDYFYQLNTEANFAEVFEVEMVDGRFFDENIQSDTGKVVLINEAALAQMGLENPVGKTITKTSNGTQSRILGVIKDFNFKSIHKEIEPLMLYFEPERTNRIMIESKAGETPVAIAHLRETWSEMFPNYPLDFEFLDDAYASMYQSEMIIGKLAYIFAGIAISISCLGLFGLITFITLQKTKEIGIRKVLGASVTNIVSLLSKDLLVLVVIGILLAAPIAWYLMDQWLQNFAFRVDIAWWVYLLAGLIALAVTTLTISYQSIRAALVNPIYSLKTD